ncbi:MAG: amidohydrolase family protein [Ilumatobacteraceae bacterium]
MDCQERPNPAQNERWEGGCDTHVHVYDHSYPVSPAAVLRPPDASTAEYRTVQEALGLERVVFVQPTTYGLDNSCQIAAASAVGDAARLVVVIDDTTPDDEIDRLTALGARGARFHMLPGGAVPWEVIETVGDRVTARGWHIQLQLNGRELPDRISVLRRLRAPIVVDHVGRFMPPVTTDDPAFRLLLGLIDDGRCWVKLSAPYESMRDGAPTYPAVSALAHELVARAPERVLWASNWPHPGQDRPPTPFDLCALRDDWLPTEALRRRVLVDNPAEVYDFAPITPTPRSEEHP